MKITKICIEIEKGKKLELSTEDAQKLYNELHNLFGVKYAPYYPFIYERPGPYTVTWTDCASDKITCSQTTTSGYVTFTQ